MWLHVLLGHPIKRGTPHARMHQRARAVSSSPHTSPPAGSEFLCTISYMYYSPYSTYSGPGPGLETPFF